MGYLERLKNISNVPDDGPKETKELPKPNCLGFLGSSYGVLEKIDAGEPANDQNISAYRWLLHFADREPLEVAFSPEATHAEVLDTYPDALAAEPIEPSWRQPDTLPAGGRESEGPRHDGVATQSCRDCAHFKVPGHSSGYCGAGRADLRPAYGAGHPLRQLPADRRTFPEPLR